jgi:hypothetical protein
MRLGVAVSGDGYRGSGWALGALLAIRDTGETGVRTSAVASVSGASLTNAALGRSHALSPATADDAEFRRVAGGITGWTGGLALAVAGLVALLVAGIVVALTGALGPWWTVGGTAVVAVAWAFVAARVCGDVVFGTASVWWALSLLGFAPWVAVQAAVDDDLHDALRIIIPIVAVAALGPVVGGRGRLVERAFQRFLGHGGRGASQGDLDRDVDHVFSTTELAGGTPLFVGRDFLLNDDLGTSAARALPLGRLVQWSSNTPVAFPARIALSGRFGWRGGVPGRRPMVLALVDGGIADGLADEWFLGLAGRRSALAAPDSPASRWEAPDVVVVVTAARALARSATRGFGLPVLGELPSLLRVNAVLAGAGGRRQRLTYAPGAPTGVLVDIAANPYASARAIVAGRELSPGVAAPDAVVERAQAALDALAATGDEAAWDRQVAESASLGAGMMPLDRVAMLDVVHHAYVLTRVQLFVLADVALPAGGLPTRAVLGARLFGTGAPPPAAPGAAPTEATTVAEIAAPDDELAPAPTEIEPAATT